MYKYKTGNNSNLHCPIANLSKFNNGAYISGIKDLTTFLNILILHLNLLLHTEGSICLYSLREQKTNHNNKAVANLINMSKSYI